MTAATHHPAGGRWPDRARLALLLALVAIAATALAGCATRTEYVEVRVPVPIECRVAKPVRPAMPTDTIQRADPLDRKIKAAIAELEIREGYEIELRTALDVCTKPIEPDKP